MRACMCTSVCVCACVGVGRVRLGRASSLAYKAAAQVRNQGLNGARGSGVGERR